MTASLDAVQALAGVDVDELEELACRASLGVWTARRVGLDMAPLHWEWCHLRATARRLALVAPREHAKSETFTVNGTVWESIYHPGLWTYVFAQTSDQAEKMMDRITTVMDFVDPPMMARARSQNKRQVQFQNYSMVTIASAGKAVRGAHPDVIIGDDVLEEDTTATAYKRRQIAKWWQGTVSNMAHPGTRRVIGEGENSRGIYMKPTRIMLIGTPFHEDDLLMGMKKNPMYQFRRYAAEFHPEDLVPGTLAVEVS